MTAPGVTGARHRLLFVYGTLRRGQSNHHHVRGAFAHWCTGLLDDHALFVDRVPWVLARRGHVVVGELLHLPPARLAAMLARTDRLEGYVPGAARNSYERVLRTVRVPAAGGLPVTAWVYVAGPAATSRIAAGAAAMVAAGDFTRR